MTADISAYIKKNIKIGEFLCSHFNIEVGRKKGTFSACYMLLFQEGKTQPKHTKKDLCCI